MKYIAIYSLLLFMSVLAGCPAHMDYPLDEGTYAVPQWVVGIWTGVSEDGKKEQTYRFDKLSEKGQVRCFDIDSMGYKTLAYDPVIMSSVDKKVYISVNSIDEHGFGWGYLLFEFQKVSEREFILIEISDGVDSFSKGPEYIKKFLASSENKDIYGDRIRFVKK